jgi:hypothetical protein
MDFYELILGVLCVWRLTHLLHAEDGPWDLLALLRRRAGEGFWGGLLDCFYCLSLWIALPFAGLLGDGWRERLLLWPALSGAAILLERSTRRPETPAPAVYWDDPEELPAGSHHKEDDDVLRQAERTDPTAGLEAGPEVGREPRPDPAAR